MYLIDEDAIPSTNKHITYRIKKGDTLESVAQQLDIDIHSLRSYHNRFCPTEDYIRTEFPSRLEFVILAPEKVELTDEEKEKARKKVVFNDAPYQLSLDYAYINKTYGVSYTIENGAKTTTIKQEINVKWEGKSDNHYYFFEVSRKGKIYINDTEADTVAQKIAEKASNALYPLLVVVDATGKWVYINNFRKIEERWEEAKHQILEEYKGDFVQKYLSLFDKNLTNSDTLFLSLSKDWFLNAFFNSIHQQYTSNLTIQRKIEFPFIDKADNLNYKVEQKLDEYLDIDNFIVIDINGELNDNRSKTNFENELKLPVKEYSEEKITGNYRAKYFLNPNNYMPETVFITCNLALDTTQKYSAMLSNVNDQKEHIIASREPLFLEDITEAVNKTKKDNREMFWMIVILIVSIAFLVWLLIYFPKFLKN